MMLNTYNNMGTLDTSKDQIRNLLELFHQIDLRIPSMLYQYNAFRDIIIDESCLLGNPHGHKFIHNSGEMLKKGNVSVYYSTKWHYYVIECKPMIPLKILRKINKGYDVIDHVTMDNIGILYIHELMLAFTSISEHQIAVNGETWVRDNELHMDTINLELTDIINAILGSTTNRSGTLNALYSGVHLDSKYKAPMTMLLTILYRRLNDMCTSENISSAKLVEPLYYYRKEDADMAYVLSYVNKIEHRSSDPIYHIHYCWNTMEAHLIELGIFRLIDKPDECFKPTIYPELSDVRIHGLYNLLLHLYFHEMGHVKYGLDPDDESIVDEWAKTIRTRMKDNIDSSCNWSDIMRRVFINYSHYADECVLDN